MEHTQRVDAVARELEAMHAAVAAGPISASVPTCPAWTVGDLVAHVGAFCGFWAHVLCEGTGRDKAPYADPPPPEELAGWFVEVGKRLVSELRATPPETPVWTWYDADKTAGFVGRRCACELAIHRYDAQAARSTCEPVDPPLAVDGLGELFDALVTARKRSGRARRETMHLHGTDDGVTAEWLVTLHPDRVEAEPTHAKGDLALRGAVSDLLLLLYQRPTIGPVQRLGDESVLDLWYQEFTF
jgi:uncharacterized protein (TIGR03083 family)